MFLTILTWLYAGNSLIALTAYIPQIKKLVTVPGRPVNFSTLSWTMWTYSSVVATMYAYFIVSDLLLTFVSVIGLIGCATVWALVVIKKARYRKT